jgi:Polyketide cyclase / dehydrase and lipid transport
MARYTATIEAPGDLTDAFDFLSRFSTTEQWDPGVSEAEMLTPEPVGAGSRFRVVASFAGRKVPLTYEITHFDRPHAVTVRAENGTTVSEDTITFAPGADAGPATVRYHAELRLKGPFKVLEPLMALLFTGIGDRAAAGLRATLLERASTSGP